MSEFYGRIQGHRGEATRCGSKTSGITTVAKSWVSAVTTYYWIEDGKTRVRIAVTKEHGGSETLFDGTEEALLRKVKLGN
jgi:hypothetical protein